MINNENIMPTQTNPNIMTRRVLNRRNELTGYLAAIIEGNKVNIGWSYCYKKDEFDKDLGLKIALGRAAKAERVGSNTATVPNQVTNILPDFYDAVVRRAKNILNGKPFVLNVPWLPESK